jgi:hypothetical protein
MPAVRNSGRKCQVKLCLPRCSSNSIIARSRRRRIQEILERCHEFTRHQTGLYHSDSRDRIRAIRQAFSRLWILEDYPGTGKNWPSSHQPSSNGDGNKQTLNTTSLSVMDTQSRKGDANRVPTRILDLPYVEPHPYNDQIHPSARGKRVAISLPHS